MVNVQEKIDTLIATFESASFRRFAPFFLEKPMTVLNVAKSSNVSRQTIIKQLKKIEPYVESKYSPTVKGKPMKLKSEILTDYLAYRLKLDDKEKAMLNEIIKNEKVNAIIIKGNETIETAIAKIVLTVLLIGVLRHRVSDDINISLVFVDALYGEFLRSKILKEKKQHGRGKLKDNETTETRELTESDIRIIYSSLSETEDEFKNYENEIKVYAKMENEFKSDKLDGLIFRLENSSLPIVTYPRTWYEILGFTIEPTLRYTEYLKEKYKAEWSYKLKHATPKERKTMKDIEKQLEKQLKSDRK